MKEKLFIFTTSVTIMETYEIYASSEEEAQAQLEGAQHAPVKEEVQDTTIIDIKEG